jgi:nitrogen fixation NifU-like protein
MTIEDPSNIELDEIYQEVILDHYRNPRNKGHLPSPSISSRGFNPFCGDEVIVDVNLAADGKVQAVASTSQGCSISRASASILTELVKGKSVAEMEEICRLFRNLMQGRELTNDELERLGELEALQGVRKFPIRIKCALLAWATLDDGIEEFRAKKGKDRPLLNR